MRALLTQGPPRASMPFRIVDNETGEVMLESPHVSDLIEFIDKHEEQYEVKELIIS